MLRFLVCSCLLLTGCAALPSAAPQSEPTSSSCPQAAITYLQKAETYARCLSTIGCIVDFQATKERDLAKARAEVACAE
jgi:hypothetical protein